VKYLVLQHIDVEHPGILRDFMAADGIAWDAVELDEGEAIPSLDGYDALLSMGGPMSVVDEDKHPWLADEKAVIAEAVRERGMPFLGLCLGHQLLADALGGRVEHMAEPEVGIMTVELTDAGKADPLLDGLAPVLHCLQWHGWAVTELPEGGVNLVRSDICPIQAIRVGERAYGLQYHVELTATTIADWAGIPAYAASLEETFGKGGAARLEADAARHMANFQRNARILHDNFARIVRDDVKRRVRSAT